MKYQLKQKNPTAISQTAGFNQPTSFTFQVEDPKETSSSCRFLCTDLSFVDQNRDSNPTNDILQMIGLQYPAVLQVSDRVSKKRQLYSPKTFPSYHSNIFKITNNFFKLIDFNLNVLCFTDHSSFRTPFCFNLKIFNPIFVLFNLFLHAFVYLFYLTAISGP